MTDPRNNLLLVCKACEARTVGWELHTSDGERRWGEHISEDCVGSTCLVTGRFHLWKRRGIVEELIYLQRTLAAAMKQINELKKGSG